MYLENTTCFLNLHQITLNNYKRSHKQGHNAYVLLFTGIYLTTNILVACLY